MSIPLLSVRDPSQSYLSDRFLWAASFFERIDQIDFTGPFEVLSRMPQQQSRSSRKKLRLFAMCRDSGFPRM